ncbi:MAG: UDP-N-acetylmuramoyl-L-alanyl-D-glutamate--2,6-diaminopimelate ligase [Phototrophicaceae bacterium]
MPKTLQDHLESLPAGQVLRIAGAIDMLVTAPYVEDSRAVEAGGVFVARKGLSVDGHDYIDRAIEQGAVAVIGEYAIDIDIPYIQLKDAQLALGYLASAYYDFPSRDLTVLGITGTNGKTTTTHMMHSVLKEATNNKTGFISTLGADFGDSSADTGLHVTTPTAPEIQKYLALMRDAGLTHVVLEMTSHGLEQGRLSGVDIDIAIVTNVTHEHLDFHGSFESYRNAKAIMFKMLAQSCRKEGVPKISVLNADDGSFEHYKDIDADKVVSYSIENDSDYQARDIDYTASATHFFVGRRKYSLKLVGEFNIHNALAVIATADAMGINNKFIKRGLKKISSVSGRMERIDKGQDFVAIVDFAHTPDALEKAIKAGRTMLSEDNKLIVVFGSAGLRDVEKRYLMASAAAKFADMTVLTAEDPRTESLEGILNMMAEGCRASGGVEGETFIRVPDRGQAIFEACEIAEAGDLVMACGKGHEQSMCFGVIEYPWDDRDAMRAALIGKPLQTLPTANGHA